MGKMDAGDNVRMGGAGEDEFGNPVIVEDLASVECESSRPGVYDRPIGARTLYQDQRTGAEHYLIRYPEGLVCQLHRHTAAHTIIVLEGRLEANGRVIGPGSYCHFPAGEAMTHAPVPGDSCLLLFIFDGPVDAEPLDQ